MDQVNDHLLTTLTVRLVSPQSLQTIGSGVIYSNYTLNNKVYILTAAHCLFEDSDKFENPMKEVELYIFNPRTSEYSIILYEINFSLVSANINQDVAILMLNLGDVESITGKLPTINMALNRSVHTQFVAKGFPSATGGKEIVVINPTWAQELPGKKQFQLRISQDFSDAFSSVYRVDGFSGAGIFLYDNEQIYLYGVFTRFLDAGKIMYCESLNKFEGLLTINYLPPFVYTFFGAYGISRDFFDSNAERSLKELGPRFNAQLNFQLPIAIYFNAISRDSSFKQALAKIVDNQLTASIYGTASNEISEISESYFKLNKQIKAWYVAISWEMGKEIIIDNLLTSINRFDEEASKKSRELYQKRSIGEVGTQKKDSSREELYTRDISCINEMSRRLDTFKEELNDVHLTLSNKPVLIINGAAGAGKSHLLGDILQKRNKEGLPAVLLLGQLFVKGKTIWENILQQLGLSCRKQDFLETLNSIGEQTKTRTLVMIDAINEGAGKELWHDGIVSFIHDFLSYPSVALVISIRNTYWKTIIPESIKTDSFITKVDHYGFRGNEYEAVKLFCEFYKIQQPNFPLLNPEYSNPLFLHLICQGIQSSEQKVFPQGFQGITRIFGFYLKAVKDRLIQKRDIYDYSPNFLRDALNSFVQTNFKKERRMLTISEVALLYKTKYPDFPNLLGDLIEESILIRALPASYDYEEHLEQEEIVYFAYERFGDFYIANELIKDVTNKNELLNQCGKSQPLGKLIEENLWYNSGILEALAVLLPEKFDVEIFEAYGWGFEEKRENSRYWDNSISQWYLNSLRWRKIDSIDYKKFVDWVTKTKHFGIKNEEYFNFLFEISAVESHPFNSDRMTDILLRQPMTKRDGFLQQYFLYYNGRYDSGSAMPINHLIDWAWRPDISKQVSKETVRLVSQALCWILSTTNTVLRDQATKAIVNLLQNQISVLIEVFKKFVTVDDTYIVERLCAVAYGCALRMGNLGDLKLLAETVYEIIFKDGEPPEHLLLRDYCRHIIELAISKNITLNIENENFRPPYNARLPEYYPTEEEVRNYEIGRDEKGEIGTTARANGKVIFSVLSWDFGRYTISSALRNFVQIEFRTERYIEDFRKGLPRGGKTIFKNLKDFYPIYSTPSEKRNHFRYFTEERIKEYWENVDFAWGKIEKGLLEMLNEEQKAFYLSKILPFWDLQNQKERNRDLELNESLIKVWIAKRVFDLGYDGKLHGSFDDGIDGYIRNDHRKVERIGKKYQWIALYEVLGILSDNYKIKDRYGNNKKSRFYDGPWDITYRDIDPSFTSRIDRDKYLEDDFGIMDEGNDWYMPPKYIHWHKLQEDWAETASDLPNYFDCIERTDNKGEKWLYLYSSYTWKSPKLIGQGSYVYGRKEIWYMFQSFLVPKVKYTKTIKWLLEQEFNGRWLPEAGNVSNLLARERYWSPLSKKYDKVYGLWQTFEDSNIKVMLPAEEAIGDLDKDESGAHFGYKIPCKRIFDALDLSYADQDGEFQDKNGEILFSNIHPMGCMIKKDALLKFLEENDLRIVWTLLGEKNAYYRREGGDDIRKSLSGVFTLENDEVIMNKNLKIKDW